jgi:hypothetical protein
LLHSSSSSFSNQNHYKSGGSDFQKGNFRGTQESAFKSSEDPYNLRDVDKKAAEIRKDRERFDDGYNERRKHYQFDEEIEYGATDRSSFSSLRANDEMKGTFVLK